ncbi:hypothetical protein [uncultured Oscillibacter sp.]|nr:hypothetical protein [uncultured Oscillibacter sp.]
MDQTARRRRRNLIQNIAIALLSVSAVLLFAQLQLYNLGTSEDPLYLERLTGEGSPSRLREFPAPVRVVLTDSYGRYGSLGFTTNSDGFSALGLREALGSVQHLAPSTTDAFRGALSGPSIYFDFLNPLPLQVLAELTGAEGTALEGNARCLLLAAGADGSVHLYVWDGADTVLTGTVASTALSIDSLTEAVSQSGMGSVSFAFEVVEMEPLYGKLFPLSILPTELPQLPVLSAASSISGTDWLLAAFGFNINTRERYAEADGTEVITEVEADRSLHIRPSGEITYRSGTDATLEISAQEEVPTAAEAVLGASILLEQLTEDRSGGGKEVRRMESFRLKNIIILILALMNLCLLGLLGVRLTTGYSAQAEARQQMVQLFAAEGVSLDDGIIPGATPPAGLTLSRDPDEDEKLAGFLLGDELVMSDGGGGVTTYQSENGSAVFRSDGTFDVVIEQSGETADALCRAFCRAFHYEALAFSLDGEDGSASAVQTYDGAPVVNCTVSFSISGGRVASVSGTHLPQAGQTANGNGALSALDALNAFLGTVQSGAVVTAVTDLYLCYELQSTTATPMALVPAWCVSTDTADYYVNCYTGAVSSG